MQDLWPFRPWQNPYIGALIAMGIKDCLLSSFLLHLRAALKVWKCNFTIQSLSKWQEMKSKHLLLKDVQQ